MICVTCKFWQENQENPDWGICNKVTHEDCKFAVVQFPFMTKIGFGCIHHESPEVQNG